MLVLLAAASGALAASFSGNELRTYVQPRVVRSLLPAHCTARRACTASSMSDGSSTSGADVGGSGELSAAEREQIGNLVADDEYLGLTLELTELVRIAIREELKAKLRDFVGKDDYKLGDISKELDGRIKAEVARMRDKEEYELGDLSVALDTFAKEEVTRMTGKEGYEFGDLSVEIDARVKRAVGEFTGKVTYTPGDLQAEIRRRVAKQVLEYTGKDGYEFGDITREINRRRAVWVESYLGREGYEFGDLTKKALADFTGKKEGEYRFGDISKAIGSKLFGPRKRKRDD